MITKTQKEFLLPKAVCAAIIAGDAILDVYESSDHDYDLKKDRSPITKADRNAHEVIKRHLLDTRIPILSEEGREMVYQERMAWDLFWLVDPLDGTVEFLKGNGEVTVNIARMVAGKPEFGVVYVPNRQLLYFNDPDLGAFRKCNVCAAGEASYGYEWLFEGAEKLPLTSERPEGPLRVAISRSHHNPDTFAHIDSLRTKHPEIEVIEQGSSFKFCMIAEGGVDYYYRNSTTYEWDTAAGEAILRAAGGATLSHPEGTELDYNKESLANPHFTCQSKFF